MELIQNAYNGFAKGNFTMLDNLKLGYGGTKEEMARLIEDAAKLDKSINANDTSFANIVKSINAVQRQMGIYGTTAKEASGTISGSIASMKAQWENLLTAVAGSGFDIGVYIENFVGTVKTVASNVLPVVQQSLVGAVDLIGGLLPEIIDYLPELINEVLPEMASAAVNIIQAIVTGISENQQALIDSVFQVATILVTGLTSMLPQLLELGLQLLVSLATGIAENLDTIIPTVIDVILKIVETLTNPDTLSQLLMAGLTLIIELAMGLVNNIDKIVEAVFTIIENMVSFFLDPANIYMLIETAIKLVLAIGKGLIQAIPQLLSSVWEIIKNIFTAFGNIDWGELGRNLIEGLKSITKMWPKLLSSLWELIKKIFTAFKEIDWGELGRNILDGLKNGISKMWQNLKQWFKNLFGDLIGVAKKILGIASPSKVFKQFGLFIDKGLQGGLELGARDVLKTVEGLSNDVANSFNPDLTADYVVGYNKSGSSNSSGGLNAYNTATQKVEVDISIDDSISPLSFARYLLPYLKVAQKEAFA